ncbi:MAG: hypothetical protein QG576_201, partial [Bacteroidota bacterium]|nr:hypothetical protein [Bacteroidota bacterium]
MASLLEMNSLSVSYDANVVLQDINFSVRES